MKTVMLFCICLFMVSFVNGQKVNFEWANSLGELKSEIASSAIDKDGNVYTAGYYEDSVDFDPGTASYKLGSKGRVDVFIQKLDKNGDFVWAKSVGGKSWDRALSIAIDQSNNIYVSGYFYDTADFDPDTGKFLLVPTGGSDAFVLKLDKEGTFKWAKSYGGVDDDIANKMVIDSRNNIYIIGFYEGNVDFDPGSGTSNKTSAGNSDVYIEKLDSNGNFIFVKSVGGSNMDQDGAIALDTKGNIYLAGTFSGTADFDPGSGSYNLTSNGGLDIFVEKLDVKGNLIWAISEGSSTNGDRVYGLSVDKKGHVYLSGVFANTVDFNPGFAVYNLSSKGQSDIFVQRLGPFGTFVWAKSIGGTGAENCYSMDMDDAGSIYLTGSFSNTVDFDPGSGTMNKSSNGAEDAYVLKLLHSGTLGWVESFGGNFDDIGRSIKKGSAGDIYTTGTFVGKADFDPDTSTHHLNSNGAFDVFVQKLEECITFTSIQEVTACDTFTWVDGITYTASTDKATHTFKSIKGCDSLVTLHLTLNKSGKHSITACDSFTWINGITYTSSNTTATFTPKGCTAIASLDLTIHYSDTFTDIVHSCDSFTWINGITYYESTDSVKHVLSTKNGCDSIITLSLTITHPVHSTDTITSCGSFTWIDGKTYTESTNTPIFTLINGKGCDSIVTLNLTINTPSTSTDIMTICDSFTWIDGVTYTTSNFSASDTLINSLGCDSIVYLNLTITTQSSNKDIITACNNYTWIDGVTYYESTDTPTFTLSNTHGCDSVITLDLTINAVNSTTSNTDTSLVSNALNADYQWLDCENNYAVLTGETNKSYIFTQGGSFAVEVTQNSCIDTSLCLVVMPLSTTKHNLDAVSIYPNPSKGEIYLNLGELRNSSIQVLTLKGRLVYQKNNINTSEFSFHLNVDPGVYLLRLESGGRSLINKIFMD